MIHNPYFICHNPIPNANDKPNTHNPIPNANDTPKTHNHDDALVRREC